MSKVLFFVLGLMMVHCECADVNDALESVLRGFRVKAVTDGRREVVLRDFGRRLELAGPAFLEANCTGGWARDMSTLVRTGDSRLEVRGGRLFLAAGIGVSALQFGYTNCQMSLGGLVGTELGFTVSAKSGSVDSALTMDKNCTLSLERLEASTSEEVEVSLTSGTGGGGGLLDLLKGKLATLLIRHYRSGFMGLVAEELALVASDHLAQLHYC